MTDYARHHPDTLLAPGADAPDFTLHATADQTLTLSQLRGRPVILVFYPADWSTVCSDELAVFNAAISLFEAKSAVVLGVSVDSVWSHQAFIASRGLHFTLLSDFEPKGRVSQLYGAYDFHAGTSARALVLIDDAGKVAWSYLSPPAINPGVDGVLDALDALTTTA